MMFQTIAEIGIGAIAIISEQTAAGNGHGAHVVFDQSTKQYEATRNGQTVPSMEEYYSEQGYYPFDVRRHDLVGKVLADTIGLDRPITPAMSSKKKIQELKDAGMNVMSGVRVDFISDPGIHDAILRRSSHVQRPILQQGAYFAFDTASGNNAHIKLTPNTYDMFTNVYSRRRTQQPIRRLPN